jgi:outer membrane lipoprotein SlyB
MNKTTVAQQPKMASFIPPVQGVLQRKCACGNHTVAGRECAECAKKKTDLQGKLVIGASNDFLEQEADRVADQVMSISTQSAIGNTLPRIQRLAGQANDGMETTPASVDHVLASSGIPLEPELRQDMEQRFDHDFSQVQVHTGGTAEQSAREVNARAYTVGNNIVFGTGQFEPSSYEGRRLIAHELTHVVQQNTNSNAVSRKVLQRSLFSGILGGLAGAAGGALIGGLLGGPIGAIVGGVVGLVGGALLGDKAGTKSRSLTGDEIKYAKDVFKDSIDYSAITITRDSMLSAGAPRTIGNTIHLKSDWGHFVGDTMELSPTGLETLIHEMGHVWQYQNGGLAYIPESLWAQLKASIGGKSRNAAYDWRAAHKDGLPWEQWNPEQQAEAIEDYNKLLRKSKDGTASVAELSELSILLPYMQKVWQRQGAPHFEPPDMRNSPI